MEVNDVTMLGFVKAAEEFVAEHQNDGTDLGDLEKMNISGMKEDLSRKLNLLNVSDDYKLALIEVGKKAFNEYAKEHFSSKRNVLNELGQIFDIDEPKNEIINDFGIKDDDDVLVQIKAAQAKTDDELTRTFNEIVNNENKKEEVSEDVKEEIKQEPIVETKPEAKIEPKQEPKVELKEETKEEVKLEQVVETKSEAKIEVKQEPVKEEPKKTNEVYLPEKEETTSDHSNDSKTSNSIPLSMELRKIKRKSEMDMSHDSFKKTNEEKIHLVTDVPSAESQVVESPKDLNDYMSMRVLTNPALDVVLELEQTEDGSFREIALNEIKQVDDHYQTITNPGIDDDPNTKTLSSIMAGLEDLKQKQENKAIIEEEYKENEEMYENIKDAYPYLDTGFIKGVIAQKADIEKSYEENEEYILLHRVTFADIDELHEFVEVMISSYYQVNVDEKKMIVDTFSIVHNEPGIILANILGVANQSQLLNGNYDGYRVLNKETA